MTTIRKGIIYVYIYIHGMHFPYKVHIVQVAITKVGSEQSQSFTFSQQALVWNVHYCTLYIFKSKVCAIFQVNMGH